MFKFVVLSALLAVAVAKPGGLFHGGVAPVATPAAVSYAAPGISAPLAYSAPVAPAAVSHQSRIDVIDGHHAPVVSSYAAPVVAHGGLGYNGGLGYSGHLGYGYGAPFGYGGPLGYSAPFGYSGYSGHYGHGW